MKKKLLLLASTLLLTTTVPTARLEAQCTAASFSLAPVTDAGLPANQSVAVGDNPNEVAIGFFNADEFPDLATADSLGQTVSVRLGDGDGTFTAAPTISFAGRTPRSIVAGDFNDDGHDDLVVASLGGRVFFLEGEGDGTFASDEEMGSFGSTNNTRMIAARFGSDEHLDVAVSLEGQDRVVVIFGNGAGDFTQVETLGLPDPIGLVAGRLSGFDTTLDLAVVSRANRTVTIFEGEFDGEFNEGDTISVSSSAEVLSSGITAGDFNGDGAQELAVLNRRIGTTGMDENVVILIGSNSGTFVQGPILDVGFGPNQLETADLNRDGLLDLAVASSRNLEASVVLGDGAGSFGTRAGFRVGGNPLDIAIVDLDGSGAPDLVAVNQPSDSLSVYLNTCDCLPSNQAPVATGAATDAQQGSLPMRVTVATASDPDGSDEALTGRLLGPSTIAVTDIVNSGGVLSANVAAACTTPLGDHDLLIEISDGCRTTTATLRVTVSADTPPVAPSSTNATVPFGSTSSEILTPLASDNGTFTPQLFVTPDTFTGTGAYDPSTGEVTIANAGPVGSYSADLTLTDQCGLSTSATYGLTVVPAATTTTVTSATPDPSRVGEPVVVGWAVDVLAPGVATPAGEVTVSDGVGTCSAPVSSGGCSLALDTVGERFLTVSYAGDANTAPSQTDEEHRVLAGETSLQIVSLGPNPALSGQEVTVAWAVDVVAPAAGMPTGSVTVSDGIDTCSAPVADGFCSLTFVAPGPRTLTVVYPGDGRFEPSQDDDVLTIDAAATVTTITSASPDPSFFGAPVAVSWSVEVVAPGSGTPTGEVNVSDGASTCSAPVAAGTCSLVPGAVGPRTLTVSYPGDANLAASQAHEDHEVVPALTTLSLEAMPDPSRVGQTVELSWDLAVEAPGVGSPTGDVTVSAGTHTCSAPVDVEGCTIVFDTAGSRTLTATYAGDGNFAASQDAEPHEVLPGETSLSILSDSPDPSAVGERVTVSWDLAVLAPASGAPTGEVNVGDGFSQCSAAAADGQCSLVFPTMGLRTLTATYAGDGNYIASQATEPHTVGFPDLAASKTAELAVDANQDGVANPGDRVRYTVEITNSGDGDATSAVLWDRVDPGSSLICDPSAPPTTTVGTITGCQGEPGGTLVVDLGVVPAAGPPIVVTYAVTVGSLPQGVEALLVNQAVLSADGQPDVFSDDPTVPGSDDPTAIEIRGSAVVEIPTLSTWGLIALIAFLACAGLRATPRA